MEGGYETIGNPALCLFLYLTGIHFWDELQHAGDVSKQKIKYWPIRRRDLVSDCKRDYMYVTTLFCRMWQLKYWNQIYTICKSYDAKLLAFEIFSINDWSFDRAQKHRLKNWKCVGALIRPDGSIKMQKLIGTGEKPIRFQTAFNLNRSYYIRFMETIETLMKRCS